jgi:hypothetical protein
MRAQHRVLQVTSTMIVLYEYSINELEYSSRVQKYEYEYLYLSAVVFEWVLLQHNTT